MEQHLDKEKNELTGLLSVLCSALGLAVIISAVFFFVKDNLDTSYIEKTFNDVLFPFVPEAKERTSYVLSCLFIPVLLYAFCNFFLKKIKTVQNSLLRIVFASEVIFSVLLVCFYANTLFFKHGIFSGLGYAWIYFILFAVLFFLYEKSDKKVKNIITAIALLFVAIPLFRLSLVHIVPSYFQNTDSLYHFDAVYASVYRVFSGFDAGKDFNSFYGFYPYFYLLFFKLFGVKLSFFSFSAVSAGLMAISLLTVLAFLFYTLENKILCCISALAFIFVTAYNAVFAGCFYPPFYPLRLVSFSVISFIACLYFNFGDKKTILKYAGYAVCLFALLWNFETGIIVLASWTAAVLYSELLACNGFNKDALQVCFKNVLLAFAAVCLTFAAMELIVFLRCSDFVPLGDFFTQLDSIKHGFGMKKMSLFGDPWIVPIYIYVISMFKGVLSFVSRDKNKFAPYYVLFSIMGLGIFGYYQGRSYTSNLICASFPAFLLGAVFLQEFYQRRCENNFTKVKFAALSVLFLIFAALCMNYAAYPGKEAKNLEASLRTENIPVRTLALYLGKYFEDGKSVSMLCRYSSLFYSMYGEKMPFGFLDATLFSNCLTKKESFAVVNYLGKTKDTVIMSVSTFAFLDKSWHEEFKKAVDRFYVEQIWGDFYILKLNSVSTDSNTYGTLKTDAYPYNPTRW